MKKINTIHEDMDYAVNSANAKISCSKGCSACCHMYTSIADIEAMILVKSIKDKNIKIDLDRLNKQALIDNSESYWKLPKSDSECVLLNDNKECSVYENRPMACRIYSVVSPKALCSTSGLVVRTSFPVLNLVAGKILLSGKYGSLPKMLKEHLL